MIALSRFLSRRISLLPAALLVAFSGCSQFDLKDNIPWGTGKDGKFDSPMQVVPFWTTGVQNQGDKGGLRGIGGRLYFYGKSPNKPVKVKGSLVIYAFDEKGRDLKNMVPDRKYVFLAEQFQNKLSKTDLGPSYSIWLPWDEVGGPEKQISLIVRFTTEKGEMLTSEQIKVRLPGAASESQGTANSTTAANQAPDPAKIAFGNLASQFAVRPALATVPIQETSSAINPSGNTSGVIPAAASMPVPGTTTTVSTAPSAGGVGDVQVRQMSVTTIPITTSPQTHLSQPAIQPTVSSQPGFNDSVGSPLRAEMIAAGAVPSMSLANTRQQLIGAVPNLGAQAAANGSLGQTTMAPANSSLMNPGLTSPSFPTSSPSPGAGVAEVRSELEKSRALGGRIARLENVRAPMQPSLAAQPSFPPSAP